MRGDIERIEREISAGRATTRDEITNDMFLALSEQEEYLDPYSGEVVLGTDQLGRFRWQTEGGDVVHTDDEDLDPNVVNALERSDWRRSRVRPRGAGGGWRGLRGRTSASTRGGAVLAPIFAFQRGQSGLFPCWIDSSGAASVDEDCSSMRPLVPSLPGGPSRPAS